MKFKTSTKIVVERPGVKTVEPQIKSMIVGAAHRAVVGEQKAYSENVYAVSETKATNIVYVAIYGKPAGASEKVLLWQNKRVINKDTVYDDYKRMAVAADANTLPDPSINNRNITVQSHWYMRTIYPYKTGSPLSVDDGDIIGIDDNILSLIKQAKSPYACYVKRGALAVKAIVIGNDGTISLDNGSGVNTDNVAIMDDPFRTNVSDVAHGNLYIDYVYYDNTLLDKVYYLESVEDIKSLFGPDALKIGIGGAAFNAYWYMMANGSAEGLYVATGKAENLGDVFMTADECSRVLSNTVKYSDAYDIIPMTIDSEMPDLLSSHLIAMKDPEKRAERRGYVGLYAPPIDDNGSIYDSLDEFWIMCGLTHDGQYNYINGKTEEDGGTGRYGGRGKYIDAMMMLNIYDSNEKLTLCHTKHGVMDGMNVSAGTLMAIYVGMRKSLPIGYVTSETPLPFVESVSFAGMLDDIEHLDPLQNGGILSIYQKTPQSSVTVYYPCTAATDEIQKAEEYLVTATDMFARQARAMLDPHTGRGTENKMSPGMVGDKALRYKNKLEGIIQWLANKYVDTYGVFEDVELIAITDNNLYQGGVVITLRIKYKYAVNHIEVIIYI